SGNSHARNATWRVCNRWLFANPEKADEQKDPALSTSPMLLKNNQKSIRRLVKSERATSYNCGHRAESFVYAPAVLARPKRMRTDGYEARNFRKRLRMNGFSGYPQKWAWAHENARCASR